MENTCKHIMARYDWSTFAAFRKFRRMGMDTRNALECARHHFRAKRAARFA
jgi:AmiR/NasT family two-component response regulator